MQTLVREGLPSSHKAKWNEYGTGKQFTVYKQRGRTRFMDVWARDWTLISMIQKKVGHFDVQAVLA